MIQKFPLFPQIYVDQVTEEIVAVTRHCPSSHQSMILMAHTAFWHPEEWAVPTEGKPRTNYTHVPPLTVPGVVKEVVLEARLVRRDQLGDFTQHSSVINGLQSHVLDMRTHIQLGESEFCQLASGSNGNTQEVVFSEFPPGSIIVFRYTYMYMCIFSTIALDIITLFLYNYHASAWVGYSCP